MLSWLIHGDASAPVAGLNELDATWGTPPVWLTFQAYHLMIAIGLLFIVSTVVAAVLRWRGTLFQKRWLMWYFVFAVGLAFVANEVGWVAAEVGRQPWIVYPTLVDGQAIGGLRTSDGLSESVRAEHVLGSIIMFGIVYAALFVLWIMLLHQKIQHGPDAAGAPGEQLDVGMMQLASELPSHRRSLTDSRG
jgi:cytochrome d ubiquinol oxidase subunit I